MGLNNWTSIPHSIWKDIPFEEVVDELKDFDTRFILILKKHIAILGIWSLGHIFIGSIGGAMTEGMYFYFFIMSISWGIINFSIVAWIFNHIMLQSFVKGNVFKRFEVQHHVEKMLLLNVGLDTSYIFAGLFLVAVGHTSWTNYQELFIGFGYAVILQGVFLFILDNSFHLLHIRNLKLARPFLEDLMQSQIDYRQKKANK